MNKENQILKALKSDVDSIFANSNRGCYRGDETYKLQTETLQKVENELKNILTVEMPELLKLVSIKEPVVDMKLAKHCIYSGGFYYGTMLLDLNGKMYPNLDVAKKELGDNVLVVSDSYFSVAKYQYIKELDMIALCERCLNAISEDGTLRVTYDQIYYKLLTRDMKMMRLPSIYYSEVAPSFVYSDRPNESLSIAIKEMFGYKSLIMNVGGNNYISLDTLASLKKYSKYTARMLKKSGKKQQIIDDLIEKYELKDVEFDYLMPHEETSIAKKCVVEKLADGEVVVRWAFKYGNDVIDGLRVYVIGNEYYACKRNNEGEYVAISISQLNAKNFAVSNAADINLDDLTDTRLQYFKTFLNRIPRKHRMMLLILSLLNPEVEQLIKNGFANDVLDLSEAGMTTIKDPLREIEKYCKVDNNGKNMLQWLGINKYQKDEILKTTENSKHNSFIMIGDIKKVFACITPGYHDSDPLNISNFSNETFDKVLEGVLYIKEMGEICHWNNSNIESIIYLLNSITELDDEKKTNTKRIIYDLKKYVEKLDIDYFVINTYNDYLRMLRRLDGSAGKMPLYFANRDELTRFHDAAVAVYNVKRNEACNEAFKKQLKKIVSYQYESDKFDFVVISPTEANDLAYEGATLHHCVKSYVERVANGSTNIMFIRKKDDPEKPFFTVEVTNQKIIAQVHGFANRNANTEPALTEFIEDWAKKKGLTIGNINMVR